MRKIMLVLGMMACMCGTAFAQTNQENTAVDAQKTYQDALTKTYGLGNYDMSVDVSVNMQSGTRSTSAQKAVNLKMNNQNSAAMQYIVTQRENVAGQQKQTVVFYDEGIVYRDENGSKAAQPVDLMEAMRQSEYSWNQMLPNAQLFEDVYVSNTDEFGNTELTFECDPAISNQTLAAAGQTVKEYFGSVLVSPEGYIVKANITLEVDMMSAGKMVTSATELTITYNNPGQVASFELPSKEAY